MVDGSFRLRGCRSIREQLSAFLDDEVSDSDAVNIARHVSRCDDCAGELEDVRLARDAVRALPALLPPHQLRGGPAPSRPTRRRRVALALVAGGLAAVGVFAAGGTRGEIVPPVDDLVIDHVNTTGGDPLLTPVRVGR